MPLITFTSDYGLSDHYVAKVKAHILSRVPELSILDISHTVKPFDIGHMAQVIRSVYANFPEGTVHLIGGEAKTSNKGILICFIEGHWFVLPDNGLISLISDRPLHAVFEVIPEDGKMMRALGETAAQLAFGEPAEGLGKPITDYVQYTGRKARATKKEIAGQVIHIDHYGNLITNIHKTDFDILSKNRNYTIQFGRESVQQVHTHISKVEAGDVFFIFNSENQLMLGINQGNGKALLGMEFDSPVVIKFDE